MLILNTPLNLFLLVRHKKNVVFGPCNHLCCCAEGGCAAKLKECPMCRTLIEKRTKVFL